MAEFEKDDRVYWYVKFHKFMLIPQMNRKKNRFYLNGAAHVQDQCKNFVVNRLRQ